MSEQDKTNEQVTVTEMVNEKAGCRGNHHHHHGCGNGYHRRGRCFGKVLGIMLVFGLGFFAGKSFACSPGWGMHGGPAAFMQDGHMDAVKVDKFADKRIRHMLEEVKASDEQKNKASEIVKAAIEQGAPLADKLHTNHEQMRKLMSAATLDKAAIEALRADQIKLADEASKQMTATMVAVAEVLTPEQRTKLAKEMEGHHGWMHHD